MWITPTPVISPHPTFSVGRKQWSNRLPHENIDQGKEFQHRNSLHLFMAKKDGKLDKEQRSEGTGSRKNGKPDLRKNRWTDSAAHSVLIGPMKKKK